MLTPNLIATALVATGALVAGCASTNSNKQDRTTELAVAQTIHALAQEYNDAWESLDIPSIVEFHGERFEYYWFNTRLAEDFEDVLRDEWLAEITEYEIEMVRPSVEMLGTDAAVISFAFNDREVNGSGNVGTSEGAMTYVFELRKGLWKIVRIHHSGPVPDEYQ